MENIVTDPKLDEMLQARSAEVESFKDLEQLRGTAIPALFNQFYKFIQNPSSVSVETYKRMVDTDDTVGSGVDFLTSCLAGRMGAYQHKSTEVTEFIQACLEKIDGGFVGALKEMLSATWVGYGVQEKEWHNTDEGFIVKKLLTLPPSTLLFETDYHGELTEDGVLQYQRNYNPHLLSQGIGFFGSAFSTSSGFVDTARPDFFAKLGDLPFPLRTANTFSYLSIRIPKMKCVHYAHDAQGKFGNPYGRSLLRRCYKYYVMKDAFLQMMAVALDRKGTPLTIVYVDPNTTLMDSKRYNSAKGPAEQAKVRADVAARDAFKNIHNDTTIILPGKKGQMFETDFVPQSSNTEAFISALDFCNKSIMRALLLPSLVFTGGDGSGSYALGSEHAKTFEKILDSMLHGVKQVYLQQLIKELIAYNFPESAWKKDGLGDFSKRQFSQEERQKEMDMFVAGVNGGIIDANDLNDLNKMRETMGFEPRDKIIEKPELNQPGMDGENGTKDGGLDGLFE